MEEDVAGPLPLEWLPAELVLCILSFLHPTDLCKLAKANKYLNELATPLIYRTIRLDHPHRAALLFRTLLQSPHLARHVVSFRRSDSPTSCGGTRRFAESLQTSLPHMQVNALRNAVHLRALEMRLGPAAETFPAALRRVQFLTDGTVQLRSFGIFSVGNTMGQDRLWNQFVLTIIRAQGPTLEELSLGSFRWDDEWNDVEPLRQQDFPKLRKLICYSSVTFKTIFPICSSTITSLGFRKLPLAELLDLATSHSATLSQVSQLEWCSEIGYTTLSVYPLLRLFPSLKVFRLHLMPSITVFDQVSAIKSAVKLP